MVGKVHLTMVKLSPASSRSSPDTTRGDIAWRRPSQGRCKGLGLLNRWCLRRVSKKFFVVEATSLESESVDHHVSILRQDVGKQQVR